MCSATVALLERPASAELQRFTVTNVALCENTLAFACTGENQTKTLKSGIKIRITARFYCYVLTMLLVV